MHRDFGLWLYSLQGGLYKQPAGSGLCFYEFLPEFGLSSKVRMIKSAARAASQDPQIREKYPGPSRALQRGTPGP